MTFQQLLQKYNGKYVEVAGSANAKNQCTDLANAYIGEVLDLPIIEWTNAVDFPARAQGRYDLISNTPTNIPQEGDLIIWGGSVGHIAIFIDGTMNTFRSFDQNYPVGSPCHVQNHTYANVISWMRKKVQLVPVTQPFVFTDQTKIPASFLLGEEMEVQAIRGKLNDLKRAQERINFLELQVSNRDAVIITLENTKPSLANYTAWELLIEGLKKLKP